MTTESSSSIDNDGKNPSDDQFRKAVLEADGASTAIPQLRPESDVIFAVYRRKANDPEGNERRANVARQRMLRQIIEGYGDPLN